MLCVCAPVHFEVQASEAADALQQVHAQAAQLAMLIAVAQRELVLTEQHLDHGVFRYPALLGFAEFNQAGFDRAGRLWAPVSANAGMLLFGQALQHGIDQPG
ncbi:hypothetical protein D3C81_1589270 [compost metagenome]